MAHDPKVALAHAAAFLKASAPEAFKGFIEAHEAFGQAKIEQMLRADPTMILRAQGQAQTTEEVHEVLVECTEISAKLRQQEKK